MCSYVEAHWSNSLTYLSFSHYRNSQPLNYNQYLIFCFIQTLICPASISYSYWDHAPSIYKDDLKTSRHCAIVTFYIHCVYFLILNSLFKPRGWWTHVEINLITILTVAVDIVDLFIFTFFLYRIFWHHNQ
jgi:hypothetical protein